MTRGPAPPSARTLTGPLTQATIRPPPPTADRSDRRIPRVRRLSPGRFPVPPGARRAAVSATIQASGSAVADRCSATASVVAPRRADGCFSPVMHKPSRSRPAPPRHYRSSAASAGPPAQSDRPVLAVRVIGLRGTQSCRSSEPDECFRSRTDRPGASASASRSRAASPTAASLRDERDGRHSYDRAIVLRGT